MADQTLTDQLRQDVNTMVKNAIARYFFIFCFLVVASGCATALNTGSHCSVDPNFLGTENTFTWSDNGAIKLIDESGYVSPAIVEQLKASVVAELAKKGFRYVDQGSTSESVDVRVGLYLRTRREIRTTTDIGRRCDQPDCRHRSSNPTVQTDTHTVGFLAADVFYQNKPIWRGWVERNLFPSERDNAGAVIDMAVPALFDTFPP